jgi:hypothetical protein
MKKARTKFTMTRNGKARSRWMAQNHMAPLGMIPIVTKFPSRSNEVVS